MNSLRFIYYCGNCILLVLLVHKSLSTEGNQSTETSGDHYVDSVQLPKGKSPILVLTDTQYSKNSFGCYLAEILRSEGIVEFEQVERSSLRSLSNPAAVVSSYDVVLLAEMDIDGTEDQMLRGYVKNGGVLIAMRPDAKMADLFGIRASGDRPEKLLQHFSFDEAGAVRKNVGQTVLQYHGEATTFSLDGAEQLADFYDDTKKSSSGPAVTLHRIGDGCAVAFSFDLAKSVVLTRQGNPDWKNTEGDNVSGYRPHDMFSRTDGTTYYDPSRLQIPHADEMQRFLANLIQRLLEKPLPRLWYLPQTHKVIVINTGDGESNYGAQFDPVLDACASYGGSFSVYLRNGAKSPGIERTTVEQEAAWRAAGHEIGVHVYGGGLEGAAGLVPLSEAYRKIVADLKGKFGHGSRTARNHTIDWTGWVDMAEIEANAGAQLDTNYYHYLDTSHLDPLTSNGYFTGSGLPQRIVNANGKVLPIYQAATQWPDEWFADSGMTAQQSIDVMISMIEAAEEQGYYSAFVNNIHPARFNGSDAITPIWPHKLWAYCRKKGIPSWSAEMLLDFVEARTRARIDNIVWTAGAQQESRRMTFDFRAANSDQNLTLMLPAIWAQRSLESVSTDGKRIEWTKETIKGIEYAMFTLATGQAHVVADYK